MFFFFYFHDLHTAGPRIGEQIAQRRREHGLSRVELARLAGTSASYISELEAGRIVNPGADKLFRITNILSLSRTDMTAWVKQPDLPPDVQEIFSAYLRLGEQDRARISGIAAGYLGEEPGSPRIRMRKEPGSAGGIPEEETPGARIREVRMRQRLTQAQLARISGIDHRHVSAIETGRIRSPALDTVANLARALGADPRELAAPDSDREPDHRPGDMLMLDRCLRLGKRDRKRIRRIIAECPAAADAAAERQAQVGNAGKRK